MGMFDEIQVKVILPGKTEVVDTWFQTKSLQNVMGRYEITDEGLLCQDTWEYEYINDPEHILGGHIIKVEGSHKHTCLDDYHGDIVFYESSAILAPDGSRVYRDYTARFTNGELEKISYKDVEYYSDYI
jgi:hypothetical protein